MEAIQFCQFRGTAVVIRCRAQVTFFFGTRDPFLAVVRLQAISNSEMQPWAGCDFPENGAAGSASMAPAAMVRKSSLGKRVSNATVHQ